MKKLWIRLIVITSVAFAASLVSAQEDLEYVGNLIAANSLFTTYSCAADEMREGSYTICADTLVSRDMSKTHVDTVALRRDGYRLSAINPWKADSDKVQRTYRLSLPDNSQEYTVEISIYDESLYIDVVDY
jgi:hypothetical protein